MRKGLLLLFILLGQDLFAQKVMIQTDNFSGTKWVSVSCGNVSKFMEEAFLKERLEKFLKCIPYAYKVAEPVARSPKGFAGVIERDLVAQAKREKVILPQAQDKQKTTI